MMAVLPTPGSPIRTGLFFVRLCKTWIVRLISVSRPITGSNFPSSACFVMSIRYSDSEESLSSAEDNDSSLSEYLIDITKQAEEGKLDPVIGRDTEIRRTIQVLQRRTKNNPVLIGEPGVGKTAIIEGLAQRIINKEVPSGLKDKTIMQLVHQL